MHAGFETKHLYALLIHIVSSHETRARYIIRVFTLLLSDERALSLPTAYPNWAYRVYDVITSYV